MNHKEYVANFREIPREFIFVEKIPKNTMGKNSESLIDVDSPTSETYYVDVEENNMRVIGYEICPKDNHKQKIKK